MDIVELAKEWKDARQASQALPARLQGEYQLDSCLKHNREQQVFRLLRARDGAPFLLKVARGYAAPFLRQEYRFLCQLSLPFLPKAVDCFEEEGCVCLLREYLPGTTLYEMVESGGPLPPEKAVLFTLNVCQMLHSLHGRKPPLIHRDIKPQNILCSPQGTCFLLDIGSLRQYEPLKSQDTVTVLTPATAAPEQFGFHQSDVRTDIYAVGKLLFYLLTARLFAAEPRLREAPLGLRHVLRKCLSFSPKKRYQSASHLEKALRRWLRLRGLRPALVALAALVFLGCGLGLGFLAARTPPSGLPARTVLPGQTPWALPSPPADADLSLARSQPKGLLGLGMPASSASFIEPGIEAAVRLLLGKADGDPIFPRELETLTEIVICGNQVYPDAQSHKQYADRHRYNMQPMGSIISLEDLALMPNLQTVVLDHQPVWDLKPLERLPRLETLSLSYCLVRDLTPLTRCPLLQSLYLEGNPLRDLSPAPELHHLKALSIPQTKVTDLSALRGLPLERLDLSELEIEDYSPLDTLSLTHFSAVGLPESAVERLSRMPLLRDVRIADAHYRDLRVFSTFPALGHLGLPVCEIDDFSDLSGFPRLTSLDLYGQKLTSLTPFLALDKLKTLYLTTATVDDISALPQFIRPERIAVNAALAERIAQTFPGVAFPFQIVIQ